LQHANPMEQNDKYPTQLCIPIQNTQYSDCEFSVTFRMYST